jgi:hypothetical protein
MFDDNAHYLWKLCFHRFTAQFVDRYCPSVNSRQRNGVEPTEREQL